MTEKNLVGQLLVTVASLERCQRQGA